MTPLGQWVQTLAIKCNWPVLNKVELFSFVPDCTEFLLCSYIETVHVVILVILPDLALTSSTCTDLIRSHQFGHVSPGRSLGGTKLRVPRHKAAMTCFDYSHDSIKMHSKCIKMHQNALKCKNTTSERPCQQSRGHSDLASKDFNTLVFGPSSNALDIPRSSSLSYV